MLGEIIKGYNNNETDLRGTNGLKCLKDGEHVVDNIFQYYGLNLDNYHSVSLNIAPLLTCLIVPGPVFLNCIQNILV